MTLVDECLYSGVNREKYLRTLRTCNTCQDEFPTYKHVHYLTELLQ